MCASSSPFSSTRRSWLQREQRRLRGEPLSFIFILSCPIGARSRVAVISAVLGMTGARDFGEVVPAFLLRLSTQKGRSDRSYDLRKLQD